MSGRTWTVDVDGVKHSIVVDYDPKTERAAVRVDGRLTSKPMSAGEDEREVPVGSARYVVRRRENGEFDLDIPPEVFRERAAQGRPLNPRRPTSNVKASLQQQQPSRIKKWIGGVVVAFIVIGLLRYGARGLQYMRVPWQQYEESDGSFKAKFPDVPRAEEDSANINGDRWQFHSRVGSYKNHVYAVEYADLKIVVVESNAQSIMKKFLQGWVHDVGGSLLSSDETFVARNPALRFDMSIPAGADMGGETKLPVQARARGFFTVRDHRMYIAYTLAAAGDPFSTDLQQFLDSFTIPPPPAPSALVASVQTPEREEPAVVKPPSSAETSALDAANAKRLLEQAAIRRAAEPQIYLEPKFAMYHVEGCSAVTAQMQRVPIEDRPRGYIAHVCVPEQIQQWRKPRA